MSGLRTAQRVMVCLGLLTVMGIFPARGVQAQSIENVEWTGTIRTQKVAAEEEAGRIVGGTETYDLLYDLEQGVATWEVEVTGILDISGRFTTLTGGSTASCLLRYRGSG